MGIKYIRGQVIFGRTHYDNGQDNTTDDHRQAQRYTLKQCHKWLGQMRKQAPKGNWGYWPCSD